MPAIQHGDIGLDHYAADSCCVSLFGRMVQSPCARTRAVA